MERLFPGASPRTPFRPFHCSLHLHLVPVPSPQNEFRSDELTDLCMEKAFPEKKIEFREKPRNEIKQLKSRVLSNNHVNNLIIKLQFYFVYCLREAVIAQM